MGRDNKCLLGYSVIHLRAGATQLQAIPSVIGLCLSSLMNVISAAGDVTLICDITRENISVP